MRLSVTAHFGSPSKPPIQHDISSGMSDEKDTKGDPLCRLAAKNGFVCDPTQGGDLADKTYLEQQIQVLGLSSEHDCYV